MTNQIFNWNKEKNNILKASRGISFEEVVNAIEERNLLEIIPNQSKNHEGQNCFLVKINDYAYIVPYVENEESIFLKTIYPSRKHKKFYLTK